MNVIHCSFLVPAMPRDIRKEYEILLNELRQYNPELMDKDIVDISVDMLDEELMHEISLDLPEYLCLHLFNHWFWYSNLKDLLWQNLTAIW